MHAYIILFFLSLSFSHYIHRVILVTADTDLIQKTCRSTKYYDVCVSTLMSDPMSTSADIRGLAVIMVGAGMTNATATSSYLASRAVSAANDTRMEQVFKECAGKYGYTRDALQASVLDLAMDSYDYASMHIMAAADYPNACHNAFKSCSGLVYPPELGHQEDGLKQICDVGLGIVGLLTW